MKIFILSYKPTISEVFPIIQTYRDIPGNSTGGSLHIALDDGNLKDSDIEWCIKYAKERKDTAGIELASVLLKMSYAKRKKLADMFHSA